MSKECRWRIVFVKLGHKVFYWTISLFEYTSFRERMPHLSCILSLSLCTCVFIFVFLSVLLSYPHLLICLQQDVQRSCFHQKIWLETLWNLYLEVFAQICKYTNTKTVSNIARIANAVPVTLYSRVTVNVEIVVLNCQKCNQCLKGHNSLGLFFDRGCS